MKKLRQIFCVHWFDIGPDYEYEYSDGAIVCMEQRTYLVKVQPRVCSKCGLSETRRVGQPIPLGWQ